MLWISIKIEINFVDCKSSVGDSLFFFLREAKPFLDGPEEATKLGIPLGNWEGWSTSNKEKMGELGLEKKKLQGELLHFQCMKDVFKKDGCRHFPKVWNDKK